MDKFKKTPKEKFVIKPNEKDLVSMTICIQKNLQKKCNETADLTNRSFDEIINLALEYAFERMKID